MWGNQRGFETEHEGGSPASVIELVTNKPDWTKTDHKEIHFLVCVFYKYLTNLNSKLHSSFLYFIFKLVTKSKFVSYNAGFFVLPRCFPIKRVKYSSFNVQNFEILFVWDLILRAFCNFCSFLLQRWDFQSAPARGSPAIVNDYVWPAKTTQKFNR